MFEPVRRVTVGPYVFGGEDGPLFVIAGPCVIESREHTLRMARALQEIVGGLGLPFVFKSSYDKANRTSVRSYRGPGIAEGMAILAEVRQTVGVPVLTDVHEIEQVEGAAGCADLLQLPAFLCRQTDLLTALAKSGRAVNIKKGQFLAPWDLRHAVEKVTSTGNTRVLLTERGASFGYNNLVVDMRSLVILGELGFPVVLDVTHGVQLPGGAGGVSGGQPQFIEPLARAAVAVGVDAVFLEVHEEPERALSDGDNALRLDLLPGLVRRLRQIDELVKGLAQ